MNQVVKMNQQEQPQTAPCNLEVEQALLGAILVNNDAFDRVSKFLLPEHFFEVLHQHIFKTISDRRELGKVVDPVSIKTFLKEHDKVGNITVGQYLVRLAFEATTILNARDYGEGIYEMFLRREAINMAQDIQDIAYDMPANENAMKIIGEFEDRLSDLRMGALSDEVATGSNYLGEQFLESLSAAFERDEVRGVAFPLQEIGTVLSEKVMEGGNLYGLLSGSGEGKTSLAMQVIYSALEHGSPVLFLSYDQSPEQCFRQLSAQQLGIETEKQRNGTFTEKDFEKIAEFTAGLRRAPFEIIKCNREKMAQLGGYARSFIKRTASRSKGVPLIVLDHVRRVTPDDEKAHEGRIAGQINSACKQFAGETGAAWLSLMQRNSKGSFRKNPRPFIGDLYGGEQAREDFDSIFYLYREEAHLNRQLKIVDPNAQAEKSRLETAIINCQNRAEIGALKVRFGNPDITRQVHFKKIHTKYESLAVEQELEPGQELPF